MLTVVLGAAPLIGGCASSPKRRVRPTVEKLEIRNQVGGAHYRAIMHEGFWYQAFASSILTIDPTTAEVLSTVKLGEYGKSGPVTDLAIHNGALVAVVRNQSVVELRIRNQRRPSIASRVEVSELGIKPRGLSRANTETGEELFIVGAGGVVRWSDKRRFLAGAETYTSVAASSYGLVATRGRQVVKLGDGEFVGSASSLHQMPGSDQLVYTRQTASGTLVGVMRPDVREVDAIDGTRAVPGVVHAVRFFANAIWVVADDRILAFEPDGETRYWINVRGARDVAWINDNYLAIAGTFGRAVYRIALDELGVGDTFVRAAREPSGLEVAQTDGRFILAGSDEGQWLYLIGSHADLVEQAVTPAAPSRSAAADQAEATISADGRELIITTAGATYTYHEPNGAILHVIQTIEGQFWVGHDDGITILHSVPQVMTDKNTPFDPELAFVRDRIVLDGPVRFLFPLTVGGGASFVAEMSGFGAAEYRDIPVEELEE